MKTNRQIIQEHCQFCGGENPNEKGLCPRCSALNEILGGEPNMTYLFLSTFWDHCFNCGAETLSITGTSLTAAEKCMKSRLHWRISSDTSAAVSFGRCRRIKSIAQSFC